MDSADVFSLLHADGPNPKYADNLMLFGQFIGVWNIDAVFYDRDGSSREVKGEWHFNWILGSMGVQDVLFAKGMPPERRGTSLRCYDIKQDLWHVTWMQPWGGEYIHLTGRQVGDNIVQDEIIPPGSPRLRWSFTEITNDSFLWLSDVTEDDGANWFREQEMSGRRRK